MNWRFHGMSFASLPKFQALCCQGPGLAYAEAQRNCLQRFYRRGLGGLVACEDNGATAGFVMWMPLEIAPVAVAGEGNFLSCLRVREDLQGRGLGGVLLAAAKQAAFQAGLLVSALDDRHPSPTSFFAAHGFTVREAQGDLRLMQWGGGIKAQWQQVVEPAEWRGRFLVRTNDLCPHNRCTLRELERILAAEGHPPPLVVDGEREPSGRWRSIGIQVSYGGREVFHQPRNSGEILAMVRNAARADW